MLELVSIVVLFLYALVVITSSLKVINEKVSNLFLASILCHGIFLILYIFEYNFQSLILGNNYFFILSFIIAIGYSFFFSKFNIKYFESILALLCFLLFASSSYLFEVTQIKSIPLQNKYFIFFHLLPMIFGEAIFLGNIALGTYYLYREKQIKKAKELTFNALSLERLQNIFVNFSKLAFILMSLGAISGYLWYVHLKGSLFIFDFLVIYFSLSWFVILFFLITRRLSIISLHKQILYLTWVSFFITLIFLILRLNAGVLLHGV